MPCTPESNEWRVTQANSGGRTGEREGLRDPRKVQEENAGERREPLLVRGGDLDPNQGAVPRTGPGQLHMAENPSQTWYPRI